MSDDYSDIRHELKDTNKIVNWRCECRDCRTAYEPTTKHCNSCVDDDGEPVKTTKRPKQPTKPAKNAKPNNETTWGSYDQAVNTYESNDDIHGIGYVFTETGPFCGIDLDDCRNPETGEIDDWATDIIEELDSYTEISPSGTGVHILIRGELPDGRRRKGDIEIYDSGRYFTVTGDRIENAPTDINERTDEIERVHSEYLETDGDTAETTDVNETQLPDDSKNEYENENGTSLRQIRKRDDKLDDLLTDLDPSGYSYPSTSEADMATVSKLYYWRFSKMDIARIMRDYRGREKLSRDDYLKRTIDNAATGEQCERSNNETQNAPEGWKVQNGGYAKYIPPKSEDSDGTWVQITNFEIETQSKLTHQDGTKEYHLKIIPDNGSPYEITTEPVTFNDLRKFRTTVLEGWTTTFDGSRKDLNRLKEFIGEQDAKERYGTRHIGIHQDEFVTPDGSITSSGWADDPNTIFTDETTPLINGFSLTPDEHTTIEEESVREILRLLPQTRNAERFIPALGWFYAATTQPYIQNWEGEFNILNILGETGSGKTTTLEVLWRLFGVNESLPEAQSTPFSIMRMMSSTNAVPVILDEFKPTEIRDYKLNELLKNLRESTKNGVNTKGRSDMGVDSYRLVAPVCVAGEQPIQGPAEERRTILTVFKRDVTVGGTEEQRKYAELVGGEADGEDYDGYELEQHAYAYYQWLLDQPEQELLGLWQDSKTHVIKLINDIGLTGLDDLVIQGFQTIKFGIEIYRQFAQRYGLDPDTTPVTDDAIERAITYVATDGRGAGHVSHLDRMLEIMTRVAKAGYIEPMDHYKVVNEGEPDAELRVHLPSAFDKIKRYAREHDLESSDLLSNADDYKQRISDAADDPTSYITTHSQNTPPLNRCIGIHLKDATEQIEEFHPDVFGARLPSESGTRRVELTPIADLHKTPKGYVNVKGTVQEVEYPESDNAPRITGTLLNGKTAIDFISWDSFDGISHGEDVLIEQAKVGEYNGTTQLELKPDLTVIREPEQASL